MKNAKLSVNWLLMLTLSLTSIDYVEVLPVEVGSSSVSVTFSCTSSLETDFQFGAPFVPEVKVVLDGAFCSPENCDNFSIFLNHQLQHWTKRDFSHWFKRNAAFRRHSAENALRDVHYHSLRGELMLTSAAATSKLSPESLQIIQTCLQSSLFQNTIFLLPVTSVAPTTTKTDDGEDDNNVYTTIPTPFSSTTTIPFKQGVIFQKVIPISLLVVLFSSIIVVLFCCYRQRWYLFSPFRYLVFW